MRALYATRAMRTCSSASIFGPSLPSSSSDHELDRFRRELLFLVSRTPVSPCRLCAAQSPQQRMEKSTSGPNRTLPGTSSSKQGSRPSRSSLSRVRWGPCLSFPMNSFRMSRMSRSVLEPLLKIRRSATVPVLTTSSSSFSRVRGGTSPRPSRSMRSSCARSRNSRYRITPSPRTSYLCMSARISPSVSMRPRRVMWSMNSRGPM
mmetsp:Transcript_17334/g.40687  ORF Transcript_17334/g.40687 Transcript_17334/m.40687 type:complete len:205 (+) Transcript_17334:5586-6200(+)